MPLISRRAFTLLELAVTLVIVSLMTGFALQIFQVNRNVDCVQTTKAQLQTIQRALDQYAANNQRLPRPALLTTGSGNPVFGAEASSGYTTISAGTDNVLMGALPNVTLGLDSSYAADCWGNKFVYAVTQKLTSSDPTNGYPGNNDGQITLKTGTLASPTTLSSNIAYVVISMGPDGFGANPLTVADSTIRHCTGSTAARVDRENCDLTASGNTVFFTNAIDTGDMASHFDDLLVFMGKQSTSLPSNVYCWGSYSIRGWLGISAPADACIGGANSCQQTPQRVDGNVQFAKISGSNTHVCGIDTDGLAWCWGQGGSTGASPGATGQGAFTDVLVPTRVLSAASTPDARTYRDIQVGDGLSCAIGTDNLTYCWGRIRVTGRNSSSSSAGYSAAISGGYQFNSLWSGGQNIMCGTQSDGTTYCWGDGSTNYYLGAGVSNYVPNLISGRKFKLVRTGGFTRCGLTSVNDAAGAGKAYCWGNNEYGQSGNGTIYRSGGIYASAPTISLSGGGGTGATADADMAAVTGGLAVVGGIVTAAGSGYTSAPSCSFSSGTATCTAAVSGGLVRSITVAKNADDTPTPVAVAGGRSFTDLAINGDGTAVCGLAGTEVYCWGYNMLDQLGVTAASSGTYVTTPVKVNSTQSFNTIAGFGYTFCATTTSKALWCWGSKANGAAGDGTRLRVATAPIQVASGLTFEPGTVVSQTAMTPGGVLYSWGTNEYGQLGNGSWATATNAFTPVTLATGESFQYVLPTLGNGATRCGLAGTMQANPPSPPTGKSPLCWERNSTECDMYYGPGCSNARWCGTYFYTDGSSENDLAPCDATGASPPIGWTDC